MLAEDGKLYAELLCEPDFVHESALVRAEGGAQFGQVFFSINHHQRIVVELVISHDQLGRDVRNLVGVEVVHDAHDGVAVFAAVNDYHGLSEGIKHAIKTYQRAIPFAST